MSRIFPFNGLDKLRTTLYKNKTKNRVIFELIYLLLILYILNLIPNAIKLTVNR